MKPVLCVALVLAACRPAPAQSSAGGGAVANGGGQGGGDEALGGGEGGGDGGEPTKPLGIDTLLPQRGGTRGGLTVVITGSGFSAARSSEVKVTFGTNLAQFVQVVDDGQAYVGVPGGVAGTVDVRYTTPAGSVLCRGCFTYFDEVELRALTPKDGPRRGGTQVRIRGSGFSATTHVLFGSTASPKVTRIATDTLDVIVPPAAAAGAVRVVVFDKNGSDDQPFAYRYHDDLALDSVAPLTGPLAGGIPVVLTGAGVDEATEVRFGAFPALALAPLEPGRLQVTAPAAAAVGAVDLTLTTPWDTRTVRGAFAYVAGTGPLTAYSVFPHVGPRGGGNTVSLTGEGLDAPGLGVRIGGATAVVLSATPNEARVRVPAGAGPWLADVELTAPSTSSTLTGGYTYRLELGDVAPPRGPASGGTAATVHGSGLPASVAVFVGATAATVTGSTATQVELETPLGAGTVGITVRAATDPENEATLPAAFEYDEPLYLGAVAPARGAVSGGALLRVMGAGFGPGLTLSFGGAPAKDIVVLDSHTLRCRLPPGKVGPVTVTATRAAVTDTLPLGFAYFDPRSTFGGVSGGRLVDTLNVTVIDNSWWRPGQPVPDAHVLLGLGGGTAMQGLTDARGQLTLSGPLISKAQQVTVWKAGYESATVVEVDSENVSVLLTGWPSSGPPGNGDPKFGFGMGGPPALITGRVTGMKPPDRPLLPTEQLQVRVFVSQASVYDGPPFSNARASGPKWVLNHEDEEFLLAASAGLHAIAAILGVYDTTTRHFVPYLMGIRRRVVTTTDQPALAQDISLDTHLDATTEIAVAPPLWLGGQLATNSVFAWLDLGGEGFLPHPSNWGAGTGGPPALQSTLSRFQLGALPHLDADSFLFLNYVTGAAPEASVNFHHQRGDLDDGILIRELLQPASMQKPMAGGSLSNGMQWVIDPARPPDLMFVEIGLVTSDGFTRLASVIMPGDRVELALAEPVLDGLKSAGPIPLMAFLHGIQVPRFSYASWNYQSLSLQRWSRYTLTQTESFGP